MGWLARLLTLGSGYSQGNRRIGANCDETIRRQLRLSPRQLWTASSASRWPVAARSGHLSDNSGWSARQVAGLWRRGAGISPTTLDGQLGKLLVCGGEERAILSPRTAGPAAAVAAAGGRRPAARLRLPGPAAPARPALKGDRPSGAAAPSQTAPTRPKLVRRRSDSHRPPSRAGAEVTEGEQRRATVGTPRQVTAPTSTDPVRWDVATPNRRRLSTIRNVDLCPTTDSTSP